MAKPVAIAIDLSVDSDDPDSDVESEHVSKRRKVTATNTDSCGQAPPVHTGHHLRAGFGYLKTKHTSEDANRCAVLRSMAMEPSAAVHVENRRSQPDSACAGVSWVPHWPTL